MKHALYIRAENDAQALEMAVEECRRREIGSVFIEDQHGREIHDGPLPEVTGHRM